MQKCSETLCVYPGASVVVVPLFTVTQQTASSDWQSLSLMQWCTVLCALCISAMHKPTESNSKTAVQQLAEVCLVHSLGIWNHWHCQLAAIIACENIDFLFFSVWSSAMLCHQPSWLLPAFLHLLFSVQIIFIILVSSVKRYNFFQWNGCHLKRFVVF